MRNTCALAAALPAVRGFSRTGKRGGKDFVHSVQRRSSRGSSPPRPLRSPRSGRRHAARRCIGVRLPSLPPASCAPTRSDRPLPACADFGVRAAYPRDLPILPADKLQRSPACRDPRSSRGARARARAYRRHLCAMRASVSRTGRAVGHGEPAARGYSGSSVAILCSLPTESRNRVSFPLAPRLPREFGRYSDCERAD